MNFFYYCISISCFSDLREFWGFNFQCMCIKIGTSIRGQTYECLCRFLCLQTCECISCQLLLLFFDQAASPTPIICFLTLLLPSAKVLAFVLMWFSSQSEHKDCLGCYKLCFFFNGFLVDLSWIFFMCLR